MFGPVPGFVAACAWSRVFEQRGIAPRRRRLARDTANDLPLFASPAKGCPEPINAMSYTMAYAPRRLRDLANELLDMADAIDRIRVQQTQRRAPAPPPREEETENEDG